MRKLWRTYGPWRIAGKHAIKGRMVQLCGGKKWSLVLMRNIERVQP